MGTMDQQILKMLYQWGGEATKHTIEENLQIILGQELVDLRAQGLIHNAGASLALTCKGMQAVEVANLVPTQAVVESQKAREMVKRALKCVLEHDLTGYNVLMQETRKAFPARYISAVERYYLLNLP